MTLIHVIPTSMKSWSSRQRRSKEKQSWQVLIEAPASTELSRCFVMMDMEDDSYE